MADAVTLFRRCALLVVMLGLWLTAVPAFAQCTGGLIINCPDAVALQSNDFLLGYQNAQAPHYRRVTPAAMLSAGFPAAFSTLSASSGGTLSGTFLATGPWSFTAPGTAVAVTNSMSVGGTLGISGGMNLAGGGSIAGTFSGSPTFTGSVSLNGGGTLSGSFAGNPTFGNVTMATATVPGTATLSVLRGRDQNFTIATLPTALGPGDHVWVTDCLNGPELAGSGTGCFYRANDAGTWVADPVPTNLPITVGGQALLPGGTTLDQGTGNRIQRATSSTPGVNGQCAQFDANLNIVPSGGGCGAGGGSGTVSSGLINQLGYYAAAGTTISGLTTANNGVLVTSGAGLPSIATTLPTGLTIPTATISNPAITGTASAIVLNMTGKLTTVASVVGAAGFSIPQGVTPTSPANGDKWATTTGEFGRYNGVTKGPYIGLTDLSATAPIVDTSGVFSCATCLTSASGGALTVAAGSGLTIASSALSTAESTRTLAGVFFDALTTVANGTYGPFYFPSATGHVISFKAYTAGTSTPSFNVTIQANGSNVTGCTTIAVTAANTAASPLTTTCTSTAITLGQRLAVVIAGVAGSPFAALVQIIGTQSQI